MVEVPSPEIDWLFAPEFARKAVVVVEDHLYHFEELLQSLQGTPWPAQMTLVCLDRPGPDTAAAVSAWLAAVSGLQVAARLEPAQWDALAEVDRARCLRLQPEHFANRQRFCKQVAALLRPGGLLIQDIQLETLAFIGVESWWETIYLASSVRGLFASQPPACRFMSNKSGFGISFGKELMEAGFDPRDVIDKNDLAQMIAPVLAGTFLGRFPLLLEAARGEVEPLAERVGSADREQLARQLDLLLWCDGESVALEGRAVARPFGRGAGRAGQHEAETWDALISAAFDAAPGIAIDALGARLAPADALKAERVNLAARHLHSLRGRLIDPAAIVTQAGHYGLSRSLRIGRVRPA